MEMEQAVNHLMQCKVHLGRRLMLVAGAENEQNR
jgi:hypothetical protein